MAEGGYIQARSGSSSSAWKASFSSFTTEEHSSSGGTLVSSKSEQRREATYSGSSNSGSRSEAMSLRESLSRRHAYANGIQETNYEQHSTATGIKTTGYMGLEGNFIGTDGLDRMGHHPYLSPTLAGSKVLNYGAGQDSFSNVGTGQKYLVESPESPRNTGYMPRADRGEYEEKPVVLSLENGTNEFSSPSNSGDTYQEQEYMNQRNSSQIIPSNPGLDNSASSTPRSQHAPVIVNNNLPSDETVDFTRNAKGQKEVVEPATFQSSEKTEDSPVAKNNREDIYQLSQCPLGDNVTMSSEDPGRSSQRWNDRSVDSLTVARPSRAVREQYIKRLRGVGEHCVRVGTICAKSVWFWIAVVGVVAGLEGFNEEKDTKAEVLGEDLWSDDED